MKMDLELYSVECLALRIGPLPKSVSATVFARLNGRQSMNGELDHYKNDESEGN